ncbi:diphthine synthase [Halogeometricum luteum]|uniref:Diphthine synthase n=1 Tax=Halogeometricum luteum TaxID=2950537 RepID=A0ABU2FXY1_9EURY|nr:diphthine synthase [Halogeometricum sp. S3BR5-2]MDS0293388.1 diphthine synthase [Halogeometricum sp. S3BR5-2]
MLTFIGLGLYDERSITVEGRDALADADRAFAEFYTSHLVGATVEDLESYHDIDIEVRDRAGVEQHPGDILDAAEEENVAFLTAGDTMISTTHVDLRLRAVEREIETRLIHGVTAQSAASGLTGLQNYRFGKAVTLPFPYAHGADGVPKSVTDSVEANRERGLHTLVYLDIKADREEYMTGDYAAEMLAEDWKDVLGVVVARAGSEDPVVAADRLSALAEREFGDPLHMLVIPGDVHHVEADALRALGGAPDDVVEENEV